MHILKRKPSNATSCLPKRDLSQCKEIKAYVAAFPGSQISLPLVQNTFTGKNRQPRINACTFNRNQSVFQFSVLKVSVKEVESYDVQKVHKTYPHLSAFLYSQLKYPYHCPSTHPSRQHKSLEHIRCSANNRPGE